MKYNLARMILDWLNKGFPDNPPLLPAYLLFKLYSLLIVVFVAIIPAIL